MSYDADDHFPEVNNVFSPACYDEAVLKVIRDNVGKNPKSVIAELSPEDVGVHRHHFEETVSKGKRDTAEAQYQVAYRNRLREVEEALRRFHDLDQMEEAGQVKWCGPDHLQAEIDKWFERQRRRVERKRNNPSGTAPHPEMYMWDQKGRPKYQADGTDSKRVRAYDVHLVDEQYDDVSDFTADLSGEKVIVAENTPTELISGDNFLQCPVEGCNEQRKFDPGSTRSKNGCRMSLAGHMKKENDDQHRAAYEAIFG